MIETSFIRTLAQAEAAIKPVDGAPWPDTIDTANWLWHTAAPLLWREQYGEGAVYDEIVDSPIIWGMTGESFTADPNYPTDYTAGWTMGEGGRYVGRYETPASFGYRLWKAMMTPLDWIRLILDRSAVRYDPLQALPEDLPTLARWADVDPIAQSYVSQEFMRRVIKVNRLLESERGTNKSSFMLTYIFGAEVEIIWHPTLPWTRIIVVYAHLSADALLFLRRQIPPHLNAELHIFRGHSDYTGMAYTARHSDPDGNVSNPADMCSLTSTAHEIVEMI